MRDLDRWIEAGAVVKPHGIKGEVIADLRRDLREVVRPGCELRAVGENGEERMLRVAGVRGRGDRQIVSFEGLRTRDEAETLRSATVWIDRELVPLTGQDRWFVQDIIGIVVRTDEDELLGTIEDIIYTPANDVYVVRGGEREILIPAIEDVIREVDVGAGSMIVHLIEGLR